MAVELVYATDRSEFSDEERRHQNMVKRMIQYRLDLIDLSGKWRILPLEQRNRKGQEIFRALGVVTDGGSKIRLWCRPDSPETAWEFDVMPGGPSSVDALQSIVERLRSNELAGIVDADLPDDAEEELEIEIEIEEEAEEPEVDEPAEPVPAAVVPAPAPVAVPARSARDLKATLGRLHLILQRAEERQSEITRIRGRLSELDLSLAETKQTRDRKLSELAHSESRIQADLDRMVTNDKADKSLLQIEQMMAMAADIKF